MQDERGRRERPLEGLGSPSSPADGGGERTPQSLRIENRALAECLGAATLWCG